MDSYVLFESHLAHHGSKTWNYFAASRARFAKFMSKIIYFNDDDRDLLKFYLQGSETLKKGQVCRRHHIRN